MISFGTEYASFVTWNSGVLEGKCNPVMEISNSKDYFLPPRWTAERRAKCARYLRSKYTWELRKCRSGSDLYSFQPGNLQHFATFFIAITVWTCSAHPNLCEIWYNLKVGLDLIITGEDLGAVILAKHDLAFGYPPRAMDIELCIHKTQ